MRYHLNFRVEADHQPDVRDLGDDIREAIWLAQKKGQHTKVTVLSGPTIGTETP